MHLRFIDQRKIETSKDPVRMLLQILKDHIKVSDRLVSQTGFCLNAAIAAQQAFKIEKMIRTATLIDETKLAKTLTS